MKKVIDYIQKYHFPLLVVSLGILLLSQSVFHFNNLDKLEKQEVLIKELQTKVKPCDSLQFQIDSLKTEIFIMETIDIRHEITREYIFEKYPKLREEYDYFISHYTE